MSKCKHVGKRALAAVLTVALLLTTLVTFNIGGVLGSAENGAIAVADNPQEDLFFYVPEQIYLAPDVASYSTQNRYNFQWFVDSTIDDTTHLATPRTGENAEGNFYFFYENATSVTVSFKYLNQNLEEMIAFTSTAMSDPDSDYANQNSTIKLASNSVALSASNTRTDVARTRYTVSSNKINTTVTRDGLSPYLLASSTGYYIEWTASYVDGADGETKYAVAYTYVYKPLVQAGGVALRTNNSCGDAHFAQGVTWVSGVHSIASTGNRYPKTELGGNGLVTFSSSNEAGYKVGDLYAQFAAATESNGRFKYSASNTAVKDWLSESATDFKIASINFYDNNTDATAATNDSSFYTFGTSPEMGITVDSSRYTNFSQIPNLSVGMFQTDDEASKDDGAWYVADMAGRTDSSDSAVGRDKDSQSTGQSLWNNYNTIFAGQGSYSSTVSGAEGDGIKYNGRWQKAITPSSTDGFYNLRTAYYNHDGTDTNYNVSVLKVKVTFNNKQALRDAIEDATMAVASLGLRADGTSPYYDSTSSYWTNFVTLYKEAGKLLTNLDKISQITINGTMYACDTLATALRNALANVENARLSSSSSVRFLALEKNPAGNYVLKSVKDVAADATAADETKTYKYGDTLAYTAPVYPGYDYVGYIDNMNYAPEAVLGAEYTSALTGTDNSIIKPYVAESDLKYTFVYIPTVISSLVDTDDGIYNFLNTELFDFPSELGNVAYPTALANGSNEFNYTVEGNDIIAWTTDANTREQYMFLPLYADVVPNTEYLVTYDVTGTDAENVQISFVDKAFTGGNGATTSAYVVNNSGDTFTTNGVDTGRAYLKLELLGDARNGKTLRISDICVTLADTNALYIDTTNGYPAAYSPASSDPKTNMSYTTSGISKAVVTTRYNTLTYQQYQLLPYYVELQPNCSYQLTYDVSGVDASKVKFSLYSSSFVGGNGSTMNYYSFNESGAVITTGPNDNAVAQLRIDITDSAAGAAATITNLDIENLDSKTAIIGTYNQVANLGIPVKEGYTLSGWNVKSNSGGTANGSVAQTSYDRIYEYTFGSNIDIIEAQWETKQCKVIFRNDDGTVVSEQNVAYGTAATAPSAEQVPTKFGHTFAGWDTDYSTVTKNLIIEPLYTEKDIEVIVSPSTTEIFAGDTTKLNTFFEPNEPEISAVEWSSNKTSVATVADDGTVTGVAEGTATITATITYDGRTYSSTATVNVKPVTVTGIAINTPPTKTEYFTGETFDPTGLTLEVSYSNGTTAIVDTGYTITNTVNTTYAGSKTVRVKYDSFTVTTKITVVEVKITAIEIESTPAKTTYYVGDTELDTTGLVVVAIYNNGDEEELEDGDYEILDFDASTPGTKTITVAYEDFEDTFEIEVVAVELKSIAVKTQPTKTTYFVGESANYAGLTLTATYSNNTTATITDGYTVTGFSSETAGTKTLTVEYEGKKTTFSVVVNAIELQSIAIATEPTKTEYFEGEAADYAGLTLNAIYNNGTTQTVTEGYTVAGYDANKVGTQTITVTYEGKTATFTMNVKAIELVGITVLTQPAKTEYYVNDVIDATGLTLTATYNNGTSATITEGYTLGAVDMTTVGVKNVTVNYEGKTATFAINVNAAYLVSIAIETMPTNTYYVVGDKVDNAGLSIRATYSDGSTTVMSSGFEVTGYDSATAATQTLTVTLEDKTTSFEVTVDAAADFSAIDNLYLEIQELNPDDYTNYTDIYLEYIYPFYNNEVSLAKQVYRGAKDQAEIDALYNILVEYKNMLEEVQVQTASFALKGTATTKKQGGVTYLYGLQTNLNEKKFKNLYTEYENVTVKSSTRILGTGTTITVTSDLTGEVLYEYVVVIFGDVNGDGAVTLNDDLPLLINSTTGVSSPLTGANKLAANLSGTKSIIDIKDYNELQLVLSGEKTINQVTGKAE